MPGTSSTRRSSTRPSSAGRCRPTALQLKWLAPTDRYLELGAEAGAGRGFPGAESKRNGIGSGALFAHVGDDLGDSASWRAGVSYVLNRARDRTYDDTDAAGAPVTNAFSGNSRTWVVDAIYKWSPGGNATRTNLKLQGEYFRRTERGTLIQDIAAASGGNSGDYRSTQSGWYLQAVYQFMPQWRAGVRYDRLDSGRREHRPGVGGQLERGGLSDPAERTAVARDRDGRLLAVGVQPASTAVRRGPQQPGGDRPADLPAVHHEPRCAWCPQLLRTSP